MSYNTITAIRLSLASPEQIRSWSHGEVIRPATINYLLQKPEPGGLLCERIFGPAHDWSCFCGKYHHRRQSGFTCEVCGVEITMSHVRRERMGHIELAAPIANALFARNVLPLLLDLSPRQIATVLSFARHLVITVDENVRHTLLARLDQENTTERTLGKLLARMQPGDLLDEEHYRALSIVHGHAFRAGTGAEVIRERLDALDLDALSEHLRQIIAADEQPRKKVIRRLQIVEAFRMSDQKPSWMILSVLPVLPPDLRPLLQLKTGRYASSDLNTFYERILHRNKRLQHFIELDAPQAILNNERRLLQDACDALFDNHRKQHPLVGMRRQKLKSLSDRLAGKKGRFRQNLLGKRVDYSGRSVIVGGPDLQLHQCGLPTVICLELFKPFLIRKLIEHRHATSPRTAKRMIERKNQPEVLWDVLEEVMIEKVVLLNRAPTLHRLSIQAFEPIRVPGQAIQLHPLVCSSFNADFDGDQMAVHLPLSHTAQTEAWKLLLSTKNLRSPATGEPSIVLSQDIVLGCFYLTQERPSTKRAGRLFADEREAMLAFEHDIVDLHTPILICATDQQIYQAPPPVVPTPSLQRMRINTTVGRLLFNAILPERLRYRNYPTKKEHLKQLISECLLLYGNTQTAQLADALKTLGFHYATKSGISFAISDIQVPTEKPIIIADAKTRVQEIKEQYLAGIMSNEERYRQVIAIWNEATELIAGKTEDGLDPYGSLATIAHSGATKAKFQQFRQLGGMRGLIASPSGKIIEQPVCSNYLEGQSVSETMQAARGARDGFMNRSLSTADCGYLTRKLVEVGQDVRITEEDCGTTEGILMSNEESCMLGLPDMSGRILGRILAERVGEREAGTLLDQEQVDYLLGTSVQALRVRSPLTCQTPYGICRACYGTDLSTNALVYLGTAVGVIAAQSIGEPGTQLTMRTFHSGGIATSGKITQGLPRIQELFGARIPTDAAPLSDIEGRVHIEKNEQTGCITVHVSSEEVFFDEYPVLDRSLILVSDQSHIQQGQVLAYTPEQGRNQSSPIHARMDGIVMPSTREDVLIIRVHIYEERTFVLPIGSTLAVEEQQMIMIGTPLTIGSLDPQKLLALRGREATQRYLVNEVQCVYRTTGVYIHDKHIEVIVRQLLHFVEVVEEGDTELIPGAIIDRFEYEAAISRVLAEGGQPALARPVLFGLVKSALHTNSWIGAASFQDTNRVLVNATIHGQRDNLRGWKEQIIVGRKLS